MEKHRVLWIEDDARYRLPELSGPVYRNGRYELVIAEDISEAITHLQLSKFDALIVDVRLYPGNDEPWTTLFRKAGNTRTSARLGLPLLYNLLGKKTIDERVTHQKLDWLQPSKIGILTVESQAELAEDLAVLEVDPGNFRQKQAGMPNTLLLELIEHVIKR